MDKIPATMKVVRQYEKGGKLNIEEIKVPKVEKGQVLVKMEYSPINPSDLSQLKGTFNTQPNYPFVPGIEGSGIVVAAGKGILPAIRKNKRVACSPIPHQNGTWSEYMLTDATRCLPIPKNVSLEQGSMMIVNPMTAMGFLDAVKSGKHQAFVNNAANSALSKMVRSLAKHANIPLINIVRKPEQATQLLAQGEKYVLCSSDVNFESELKQRSNELNATLFFDAVGGDHTKQLIDAAPFGSTIKLYANLSGEEFCVNPRTILQNEKTIDGFALGNYTSSKSIFQLLKISSEVGKLMPTVFKTSVQQSIELAFVNEAIKLYQSNMSAGKVLLKLS